MRLLESLFHVEIRMNDPVLICEYLIKASFDYWTAVCYPSLYVARFL